jgi:hypothetical protein
MVSSSIGLPLLIIYISHRTNFITALEMEDRRERTSPYLIILFTYFILYLLFLQVSLPETFHRYLLGNAIICFIVLLVNLRYKISIHLLELAGLQEQW